MTMLRRLPKLLRLIPGTAQDLRVFFLMMQYWLAGSEENLRRMMHCLVHAMPRDRVNRCVPWPSPRTRSNTRKWGCITRA